MPTGNEEISEEEDTVDKKPTHEVTTKNSISTDHQSPYCTCIPSQSHCDGIEVNDIVERAGIAMRIVNNMIKPLCTEGLKRCCYEETCGLRIIQNSKPRPNNQAYYGEYPWHAEIIDLESNMIGAGVIINQTSILTVAHKIYNLDNNQYLVRMGKYNRNDAMERHIVVRPIFTYIHEKFDIETVENDIAIINIEKPIIFQNYNNINSACLPKAAAPANTACTTAGWGASKFSKENHTLYESILRKVKLATVDSDLCESSLQQTRLGSNYRLNKKSFLCAGGVEGKDSCTGDGGGALVCETKDGRFNVVGLTAWGIGCGENNVPGVYVNVHNYINWIRGIKESKMHSIYDIRSL
ncbi:phenoloxidase-activating factor 2-like isoform X2 [Leptopilina heterotoma]|nr:phenoloxidase-activating factor 2-like isoform X2 [Leptopilina heterotoma]